MSIWTQVTTDKNSRLSLGQILSPYGKDPSKSEVLEIPCLSTEVSCPTHHHQDTYPLPNFLSSHQVGARGGISAHTKSSCDWALPNPRPHRGSSTKRKAGILPRWLFHTSPDQGKKVSASFGKKVMRFAGNRRRAGSISISL